MTNSKKISIVLISFSSILIIANILLGFQDELPPLYSNYNYRLIDIIFDFDKILGEFWLSLLLSLSISALFLKFTPINGKTEENNNNSELSGKKLQIISLSMILLSVFILIFAIIGVENGFNFGLGRPYFENSSIYILSNNLYPEYFNEQFLSIFFLLFGINPLIVFIINKKQYRISNFTHFTDFIPFVLYVLILVILFVFSMRYSMDVDLFLTSNTMLVLIYGLIHSLLLIGLLQYFYSKNDFNEVQEIKTTDINSFLKWVSYFTINIIIVVFLISLLIQREIPYLQIGILQVVQLLLPLLFRISLTFAIYTGFLFIQMKYSEKMSSKSISDAIKNTEDKSNE